MSGTSGFGAKASTTSIRKAQDEVVERLKREASSLARLRHPSILQLVEPVEDIRGGAFMFATEAVIGPLSQALAQKDRSSPRRAQKHDDLNSQHIELDELEIQKGLLQVAKGLEFLHESAKLVHGNLTPAGVFINSKSDWKISGLGFAGPPDNAQGHQTLPQISLSEALHHDARIPASVQLDLDYTSPDFVLDSNVNFSADVFSLGLVLLACYREPHTSPIETRGSQNTYRKIMTTSLAPSSANNYGCSNRLPQELGSTLPRLLARRPAGRMNATEFQQSEYFDNVLVNTIRFLDQFPAKTPAEKSQFMRGLPRVVSQFPATVLERKILSVLLEELKDKDLVASILQNIFQIVKMLPSRKEVVSDKVLPRVREILITQSKSSERDTSKDAGLVIFLENMRLVSDNSTAQQFKEDALPMLYSALQSTTHSLVDAALHSLNDILPIIDFSTVKHDLFPVIATVFAKTSSLAIKVRGLEALSVLCGSTDNGAGADDDLSSSGNTDHSRRATSSLDKFTMQEKIVPLLKGIKTKEPAVMMAALKVFKQIILPGDIDFLAMEVMPILWSFALSPLLDLTQFKAYMEVIQSLTEKIQREQIRKLQEMGTMHNPDGRERVVMSNTASQVNGSANEEDFAKLVLGGKDPARDLFAGALSDGQKLVPNPASYSWTNTSGAASSRSQIQSRSITPDVSTSAFPSLQPNNSWSAAPQLNPSANYAATRQPLQPSNSMPALVPGWGQFDRGQPTAPSPSNVWSLPLLPQPVNTSSRLQATSYLGTPPKATNSARTDAQSSTFTPMLAPPPQSPPAGAWTQPVLQPAMQRPQLQTQQSAPTTNKSGLDKYQSLI